MTPANDNASLQSTPRRTLFATTMRLLSSLDAMPDRHDATVPRRMARQ